MICPRCCFDNPDFSIESGFEGEEFKENIAILQYLKVAERIMGDKTKRKHLFCIECGSHLYHICQGCGKEPPDGAMFCPWCGWKIKSIDEVNNERNVYVADEEIVTAYPLKD